MKKIVTSFFMSALTFSAQAEISQNSKELPSAPAKSHGYQLTALYGYQTFNFDSSRETNYNRFAGHLNLYLTGGNNFYLREGLTAGLSVYHIDSNMHSALLINPNLYAQNNIKLKNDSLYGRLFKTINDNFFINLMGGLGHNDLDYSTLTDPITINEQIGHAHGQSDNWFASINAIYSNRWRNWQYVGSAGILYNQINQSSFNYFFTPRSSLVQVPFFQNKSTFALENMELNYKLNDWLTPFADAGLLQVLQFSNNRPTLTGLVVGPTPEFNLDKNGYRVGGGLTFKYKQVSLRLEHQYSRRGNIYHSNMSVASVRVSIA